MAESSKGREPTGPLADLDDWESAHTARETGAETARKKEPATFRDYRAEVRPGVREFYRQNHSRQTLDFVLAKKRQYLAKTHRVMGIWEAMEFLNTLVDDSDPDTELSQIEHLMQTSA